MFNFQLIGRECTRDIWQLAYRVTRKHNTRGSISDESALAERVALQTIIDNCTEQGEVGVVESGMDCDCVQYCHGRAYPGMRAIQFQHERDSIYEWADGPCNVSLCKPSELPQSYSRDLVMEAYENGHPHIVYP